MADQTLRNRVHKIRQLDMEGIVAKILTVPIETGIRM